MTQLAGGEHSSHQELAIAEPDEVRQIIRKNRYAGHTAGLCEGVLQCNLVILPEAMAADFQNFCEANTVFCPLLAKSRVGEFGIEALGSAIDLRTDLPLYNIHELGQPTRSMQDISSLWRDDFVAFAVGCSFTFERALLSADIPMRHIEQDVTVPMFKTNIQTTPVGAFGGPAVVSMRPIKESDIPKTNDICSNYTHAHGVPIHIGNPADIGIRDINNPNWGSAVTFVDGEVPVFWGCGVTTQVAITHANPEICITHAPGAMLITQIDELSNSDWRTAGPLDE
ncbi:UNVERIFIED_CONTAM: hypothetical protein GTU68_047687 [Idotea baltica]|nr:hypothetical protein [Idotea baltica]